MTRRPSPRPSPRRAFGGASDPVSQILSGYLDVFNNGGG